MRGKFRSFGLRGSRQNKDSSGRRPRDPGDSHISVRGRSEAPQHTDKERWFMAATLSKFFEKYLEISCKKETDIYFENFVQFRAISFKSEINTTILKENVWMNDFVQTHPWFLPNAKVCVDCANWAPKLSSTFLGVFCRNFGIFLLNFLCMFGKFMVIFLHGFEFWICGVQKFKHLFPIELLVRLK